MSKTSRTTDLAHPTAAAAGDLSTPVPNAPPSNFALKQLVFWAGAVLMGLEIAGSRMLAPHFGNSVFVWGSLISVVLTALSVGYSWGGRISDRHPSLPLLCLICIGVSVLIFSVAFLAHPVCDLLLSAGLGEQTGPLVAGVILFLPASIGMGMVSPFAVRLATHSVQNVGRVSGNLYALSTLGSITGTLLTTFVLIPLLGLSLIIKGLAAVLLLVSLAALPWQKRSDLVVRLLAFLLMALPGAFVTPQERTFLRDGDRVVFDADTPYHHITVVDNRIEDSRQLRFDRYVESAVRRTPPHTSLARYTDYFHLAFLVQPDLKRSLFIGAGGGVGPRAFRMHDPGMEIDVVDIDPEVLRIAKDYFYLEPDDRLRLIARDGRMFVRQSPGDYDCIVLDAFTIGGGIPFHLVTREFFDLCRKRMTDRGVFVMNINSAMEGPDGRIFHSMLRTFESVFPRTYAFAMDRRYGSPEQSRNILLVATPGDEPISPQEWQARAATFVPKSYLTTDSIQAMIDDLVIDRPDTTGSPLFTDDHSPIETMSF